MPFVNVDDITKAQGAASAKSRMVSDIRYGTDKKSKAVPEKDRKAKAVKQIAKETVDKKSKDTQKRDKAAAEVWKSSGKKGLKSFLDHHKKDLKDSELHCCAVSVNSYLTNAANPAVLHEKLMQQLDDITMFATTKAESSAGDKKKVAFYEGLVEAAHNELVSRTPLIQTPTFEYVPSKGEQNAYGHDMHFHFPVIFPKTAHRCTDGTIQGLRFEYWEKITETVNPSHGNDSIQGVVKTKDWTNIGDFCSDCFGKTQFTEEASISNSLLNATTGTSLATGKQTLAYTDSPKYKAKQGGSSRLLEFRVVVSNDAGDRKEMLCHQYIEFANSQNTPPTRFEMAMGPGNTGMVGNFAKLENDYSKSHVSRATGHDFESFNNYQNDPAIVNGVYGLLSQIVNTQAQQFDNIEYRYTQTKLGKENIDVGDYKRQVANGQYSPYSAKDTNIAGRADATLYEGTETHQIGNGYAGDRGTAFVFNQDTDRRYQLPIAGNRLLVIRIVAGKLKNIYVTNNMSDATSTNASSARKDCRGFTEIPWEQFAPYYERIKLDAYKQRTQRLGNW